MAGSLVGILVAACVIATVIQEAQAVCCGRYKGPFCKDCTKGTPYCGYGGCNIFGCACENGCRKSCDPKFNYDMMFGYPLACGCSNKRSLSDGAVLMDVASDHDTDRDDYIRN
ncbi:uncharacterized protein LOC106177849 [Lingula anatina]|uniref:Uncharacterized protein LOC106177849 n=1 Tax=Lingula anatina TaxID=7574 RepID=A0A1S3K1E1_LINAN|nr:uncharacterized protein LOC106177849 [Lingula anatina]|eukprot:XP_013416209.1 uncharacterized protein LOC106177849 [Lingula anatina]